MAVAHTVADIEKDMNDKQRFHDVEDKRDKVDNNQVVGKNDMVTDNQNKVEEEYLVVEKQHSQILVVIGIVEELEVDNVVVVCSNGLEQLWQVWKQLEQFEIVLVVGLEVVDKHKFVVQVLFVDT